MDEMRALLDSLMGADRNEPCKNRKSFKDPGVCHFFVLAFCPHDLFPNTKSDLGPCPNQHSESFKSEFLSDPDHDFYQWRYEEEFIDRLQRLINVVELRIKRGNERILGHDEQQIEKDKEKKLDAMRTEVQQMLKVAEKAGEAGSITEAEAQTAKANELRRKIDLIAGTPVMPISAQEKSLRVCEVCASLSSYGDAASRFESHVNGKQHKGYELIRATFAKLVEKHKNEKPPQLKSSGYFSSSAPKIVRGTKDSVDLIGSRRSDQSASSDNDDRRPSRFKHRRSYSRDRHRERDRSRRLSRSPLAARQQPRHYDDSGGSRHYRVEQQQHRRSGNYSQSYSSQRRHREEGERRSKHYYEKEETEQRPTTTSMDPERQRHRQSSPLPYSSRYKEHHRNSYDRDRERKRNRSRDGGSANDEGENEVHRSESCKIKND